MPRAEGKSFRPLWILVYLCQVGCVVYVRCHVWPARWTWAWTRQRDLVHA